MQHGQTQTQVPFPFSLTNFHGSNIKLKDDDVLAYEIRIDGKTTRKAHNGILFSYWYDTVQYHMHRKEAATATFYSQTLYTLISHIFLKRKW